MKKILIIQSRIGIGDMCVFLPCIHAIAKTFNDTEIHLLTKERSCAKDFLYEDIYIKKIHYLPNTIGVKLNFWILNFFCKNKFSACYILHYSLRYFLLAKLSGINLVKFYGFLKKDEDIVKKSQEKTKDWISSRKIKFDTKIYIKKNKTIKNQITIGIGGSGDEKKWSLESYVQLIKLIKKKRKSLSVILAGGKREINDGKLIMKKLKKTNIKVISLCKKNIKNSLSYLSSSEIYVGNDTGFMHLSGSLGVRSFGIFGPSSANYCNYNKKNIKALKVTNQNFKIKNCREKIINQITPSFVFEKINKYI